MTDRVYPSSKPNGTTTASNGGAAATNPPSFPAPKSQLYNPNRHPYRPQPTIHNHRRRRTRRSSLCLCCFWSVLLLILLLLLAAIAGCVLYVLYSPRRPSFSVTALRISKFNLSTTPSDGTTQLSASLNVTVSAKNPNKRLTYVFDPISITAVSNQVLIANGSFPNFISYPENITIIRSSLFMGSEIVDADSAASMRSDLKKKKNNGLELKLVMDTRVIVEMEKLKSKKVGIRVTCDGIRGVGVPKGKSPVIASTSDAKCKVDLRIKIWKWTF